MTKPLISQEELEEKCPFMVEELNLIIAESPTFQDAQELTIYALTELLHEKLKELDVDETDKGAVVSTLIIGLVEHNQECLAAHRELLRTILEQKSSTIH